MKIHCANFLHRIFLYFHNKFLRLKNFLYWILNVTKIFKNVRYFERKHKHQNLIIYYSGIGKVNSSGAAQYIIDNFHPGRIAVIGSCAGINRKYNTLDMIFPTKAVEYDCTVKEIEPFISKRFVVKLQPPVPQDKEVVIGTGDKPVILWSDYELLLDHGIDVADMESAAIAYICKANKVPCTVIKGISDFPYKTLDKFKEQIDVYDKNAQIVTKRILSWFFK